MWDAVPKYEYNSKFVYSLHTEQLCASVFIIIIIFVLNYYFMHFYMRVFISA